MATKRVSRSTGGNALMLAFLVTLGSFMALPIVYTAISAFKPLNEMFLYPPRFLVTRPTLDNFVTMFSLVESLRVPFERYLFNSLFIAVVGTFAYILVASLAAFPLAKHRFLGKTVFFQIVVWALLFRPEVTSIPQYLVISKLNLINTYLAVLLPALSVTFGVFLMRQFMLTIPDALLESSRIDGAGEYRTFFRIVLPMVKPAWLTLGIFTFQSLWNTTGVQYIYDERMKMLPVALQQIATAGIARAGAAAVVGLLLMIPPIVFFLFTQASVIETMSHSGLK